MTATPDRRKRSCGGFSLLEVLVAFAILAMMLGVLLQIFSLAVRTTHGVEIREQALLLAESKLAELGAGRTLKTGSWSGRIDDRFTWQSRIERFSLAEADLSDSGVSDSRFEEALRVTPYLLTVTVSWPGSDGITLNTIRLVQSL